MPRTGQPSTRDVEATVRAVEILDALAEGGELGTTDVSRRTGISASTVSRQLGTLDPRRPRRARRRDRPLPARRADAALRERGARPAQPPRPRPPAPRGARARRSARPATLSIPGDGDAITVDFVPTDRYLQGVTRLGRPSIGHASSAGKVMLAFGDVPLPRGKLAVVHAADDHRPGGARGGDRARPRAGLRRGGRGARGRPQRRRGAGLGRRPASLAAIVALQGPTSRFDASRDRRRRAAPPRRARSGSPWRSAGTSRRRTWPRAAYSISGNCIPPLTIRA